MRRAAFYRAVQFVTAVPLNAFLFMTLDNPHGVLGARNQTTGVCVGALAFFALCGILGFLTTRRRMRGGFLFYALGYLSILPWFTYAYADDWVMSLIGILVNGSIAATLLYRTRWRMKAAEPVLVAKSELFGAWGSALLWLNSMAVMTSILEAGYRVVSSTMGVTLAMLIVFGALTVSCLLELRYRPPSLRHGPRLEWVLLGVLVVVAVFRPDPSRLIALAAVRQFVVAMRHFLRTRYAWMLNRYFFRRPAQLAALSFIGVILFGTLWLSFPYMSSTGTPVKFINALFTATSAVCVTGLTALDTAKDFSVLGQAVILVLIQIGGLGIMTLSTFAAIIMGRNVGLGQEYTLSQMLGDSSVRNVVRLVKFICLSTILIESVGVLLLLPQFAADGGGWRTSLWNAVFYGVSAFNNAGFALRSDNLVSFQRQPGVLLTLSMLVVLGGLGFGVLHWLWLRIHGVRARVSFHVIAVLLGSVVLLVVGTFVFWVAEANNAFKGMSMVDTMVNAWFQSVTPRTAGFNAIDMETLHPFSRFFTIVLMFIGVAPGSTGGGVKITTVVVLLLAVRAIIRGKAEVYGFGYSLDTATVLRSAAILMLCLSSCVLCLAVLLATQHVPAMLCGADAMTTEKLMFETVSAFGTVGLSMNVTPKLNDIGKLAVIALMYVGRVGALTLVLSLQPLRKQEIIYPRADVMVG